MGWGEETAEGNQRWGQEAILGLVGTWAEPQPVPASLSLSVHQGYIKINWGLGSPQPMSCPTTMVSVPGWHNSWSGTCCPPGPGWELRPPSPAGLHWSCCWGCGAAALWAHTRQTKLWGWPITLLWFSLAAMALSKWCPVAMAHTCHAWAGHCFHQSQGRGLWAWTQLARALICLCPSPLLCM